MSELTQGAAACPGLTLRVPQRECGCSWDPKLKELEKSQKEEMKGSEGSAEGLHSAFICLTVFHTSWTVLWGRNMNFFCMQFTFMLSFNLL